jgi:1,4-dihydroxy-2-naphthoate octaprenyltransferase
MGLGEIFVFIFFGVVATVGSYFVQTEDITFDAFAASISMGSFACALLAINNIRDRALDGPAGKRTLAVRLGDRGARYFFVALIALGYAASFAMADKWVALTLLTLTTSIPLIRGVLGSAQGKDLIPFLAKTGQLQLRYALLLAIALQLSHG